MRQLRATFVSKWAIGVNEEMSTRSESAIRQQPQGGGMLRNRNLLKRGTEQRTSESGSHRLGDYNWCLVIIMSACKWNQALPAPALLPQQGTQQQPSCNPGKATLIPALQAWAMEPGNKDWCDSVLVWVKDVILSCSRTKVLGERRKLSLIPVDYPPLTFEINFPFKNKKRE